MKRRSRAGGNRLKGERVRQRSRQPAIRRRAQHVPHRPTAGEKTEVGRLTRELNEALERQTATSDVLQIISRSPDDLQPVFQAMLKNAVRLCDAKFGNIYRWDGDALHFVATENAPVAFAQARGRSPLRPSPQTPTGRMIATKTVVHAADMRAENVPTRSVRSGSIDRSGRSLAVYARSCALPSPMLKEDELIGAFSRVSPRGSAFH